jgi:hypothetical protein
MHLHRTITELTREHNDFADDHFRDAASIAKGRIKDGYAVRFGGDQIDLVGTDAEAAESQEPASFGKNRVRDLGLTSNAQYMHIPDLLFELILAQGARQSLNLIAFFGKKLMGSGVDVLQEKNFDLVFRK